MVKFTTKGLKDSQSKAFGFTLGQNRHLSWTIHGELGKKGINDKEADLLDLAFSIFRGERMFSRYQRTNPVVKVELEFAARNPKNWNKLALKSLEAALQVLGNAEWRIKVLPKARTKVVEKQESVSGQVKSDRKIKQVILFSGGMDSTCGLIDKLDEPKDSVLVSFYKKQKSVQQEIASELGFDQLVQATMKWEGDKQGYNKSFFYRSFLFISLASAVANTFEFQDKVKRVLQYENGVLSLSIPPSPAIMMTKHAHPTFHKHYQNFLKAYFRGDWEIINPFKLTTKRKAVLTGYEKLARNKWNEILLKTESCWYQYSNQLGTDDKGELIKKANNKPCGICIPCLIRRSAFKEGDYDIDFCTNDIKKFNNLIDNSLKGAYLRSYYYFIIQILETFTNNKNGVKKYDTGKFYSILPAVGREVMDDLDDIELEDLHRLFAAFALEFKSTYSNLFKK